MKNRKKTVLCRILAGVFILCFLLQSLPVTEVAASNFPVYEAGKDIDYTGGEGAEVELTHKKDEPNVSYEVNDTRLTRNATFYMSMQVKFTNSHSWGIRVRNVTCKIDGETVTGAMEFRTFKKNGTLQVNGKNIDSWPTFNDISDDKWHELTVRSSVDSFEIWVDGVRGQGFYYNLNVTDMVSNYTCPAVILGGWNEGTVKNIRVWNDGTTENPVMPADKVTQKIEALPDAVSLKASGQKQVADAVAAYEALSDSEKSFVSNYDKLLQLQRVSNGGNDPYDITVSGSAEGAFTEVFPDGVLSQQKGGTPLKYYFETEASRNSTLYTQCVIHMEPETNCFDIVLRNQSHTAKGKKVTGPISIRMFKNSAVVLDSRQNAISDWVNYYGVNLFQGSHVITVESTPTSCTLWIDEVKYEVPAYLSEEMVSDIDCIQAQSGIYLSEQVTGTVSNIRVWNDRNSGTGGQNRYAAGDAARIAILRLPELEELSPADASDIEAARKLCDQLSEKEQKYVTNLDKLERLERAMKLIEEKGAEHAYAFLKDELPKVEEDYLNLISTGTISIPTAHSSTVNYNANTHELKYTDCKEYINSTFKNIEGITAEDTWLLKFTYTPYEYYYEKASANWMGLRITFSGYTVGGNGATKVNRSQLAFMVSQFGIMSVENGNNMPNTYQSFKPELGQSYQVTMLCEQGRMKVWVNGEVLAYYDELPTFPCTVGFESSRCRCDITDIQLYNMSSPTVLKTSEEGEQDGFQYINDLLYDVKGAVSEGQLTQKQTVWILAGTLTVAVVLLTAVIWFVCLKRKGAKHRKSTKGGSEQ